MWAAAPTLDHVTVQHLDQDTPDAPANPGASADDAVEELVEVAVEQAATERPPSRPGLSPSRANDFLQCPQLFRFRVIDRLPEPPSSAAARGTLVHAVLEHLFDLPRRRAHARRRPRPAARASGPRSSSATRTSPSCSRSPRTSPSG